MQETASSVVNLFLATIAPMGKVQRQWRISGQGADLVWLEAVSMKPTSDSGVILLGHGGSKSRMDELYIFKLDRQGAIEWQERMGSRYDEYAVDIGPTSDGGYILVGTTPYSATNSFGTWVVKVDHLGSIEWQKKYGSNEVLLDARCVQQTFDGGFIVGGGLVSAKDDAFLLKLDATGGVSWQRRIGSPEEYTGEAFTSVRQTADGGYIAAGYDGQENAWVVKFDSTGAVSWQKAVGGPIHDSARAVEVSSNGGYVVAGEHKEPGHVSAGWLFKLDDTGHLLWQKNTSGGLLGGVLESVAQAPDGGFLGAGTGGFYGGDRVSIFMARYDRNGAISEACNYSRDTTATCVDSTATVRSLKLRTLDTAVRPASTSFVAIATTATMTTVCAPARIHRGSLHRFQK